MRGEPPPAGAWAEIERLFAEALDLEPAERADWLESACDDPGLRSEVLRLLQSHDTAGDFLTRLDAAGAAELLRIGSAPTPIEPEFEGVGPYRVIRLLARGGMGVVYLAHDERLGRQVALKRLPRRFESDPAARDRFLAEARAASTIDHPHIATVHDVGETPDGGLFIAMSFYDGVTLADRIADGPLEVDEALALASQVADGLGAAHARDVIHRDIKPANVLVTTGGTARILDFGIAKTADGGATREGIRLGTVSYMSPEQTRCLAVDARTDVWSFGILLFEMLTGRQPFGGAAEVDDAVLIHAIRHDSPPRVDAIRPEVPRAIADVVERCLAREPADRYADGDAVRDELSRLTLPTRSAPHGHPRDSRDSAGREGPGAGGSPRTRTRKRLVAAGLGGAALVAVAGGFWFLGPNASSPTVAAELDPDLVLVLPFTPAAEDSVLEHLGRDLGVTLSTSLDGLGELRTVDGTTVLASAMSWKREDGIRPGLELARQLGAGRVLHGVLLGSVGSPVRADVTVYRSADGATEARAPAMMAGGDLGAATDSVAWVVVRGLWPSERTPAVEPEAVGTTSLPALRAFLEGELATAEGRWRDAPESFARAIEIDSTFWLAYARHVEAMSYRSRPVAPEILATLDAHLADLPPRERAIIEARKASGLSERLQKARALVERLPGSWRAWFDLADQLIHNGMYLGTTVSEARTAIERATALHPNSATLWQHTFWMALAEGDSAATGVALAELGRLGHDSASVREVGLDELQFYRYLHGLAAGGDGSDPLATAWRDSAANALAEPLVHYSGPLDLASISGAASIYGSHRGEIALDEAVLRLPTSSAARAGALRGISQALAGRGAWDSALVVLDRYVSSAGGLEPALHALRLGVVGEWLGAIVPGSATPWRAAVDRQSDRLAPRQAAELAWLDGIAAYARGDEPALAAARARLVSRPGTAASRSREARGDSIVAAILDRSLAAFELGLSGRTEAAAEALSDLEYQRAEDYRFRRYGDWHPYLTAVNRVAAARWLMAARRPAEAARLLRWHEAVQFPTHLAHRADASLRGIIFYERGRAAATMGSEERARSFFLRTAAELDAPVAALRPVADSARAALEH